MNLNKNDNFEEYEEFYFLKENKIYEILIRKIGNKIIIQHKHYLIQINKDYLSKIIKTEFNSINDCYKYIIDIFENNRVYIKEIIVNKEIKLLLKINDLNEEKEMILVYNKQNNLISYQKDIYYKLNQEIYSLKEEIKILKEEITKLKQIKNINFNNYTISKEVNLNMKTSQNDKCPIYIQSFKDLINDSYLQYALDNTYSIFKSINNSSYIVYSNKNKSIITYNIITNEKISEIKNAHNQYITNFRHYFDKIKRRDLIISISSDDNNIKLWDFNNWELICDIKSINNKGYLYSACFLNIKENNINYILSSNDNYSKSEYIKVYDFNGNKIKEISDSNERTFFIDTYYDNKFNIYYIIAGNNSYVKSYNYNENKLYHKYIDNNNNNLEDHDSIIIINNKGTIKMIESSEDGILRIWNFHSGLLLDRIVICEDKLYGICLWNNNYLFVGGDDKTLKIIDLDKKTIINNLFQKNSIINIKKFEHPIYGECIIIHDWENQIKLGFFK